MKAMVLPIALVVSGCVTTTEQANSVLKSSWIGKNADQFFAQHGLPSKQYTTSTGGRLYEWSDRRSMTIPGSATTTVTPTYGGLFIAQTSYTPATSMSIVCAVAIEADAKNTIRAIRAANDSIGWWQTSRCHEIFGPR